MLRAMWKDEDGAIVSIEMIIIITVAALALIVGWSEVAVAVNTELNDISTAVGRLNQSFFFAGFASFKADGTPKANVPGAVFIDLSDDCDEDVGHPPFVCAFAPPAAGG